MCLLHTHPATTVFDQADIEDFYTHNPDGVGVMWAEDQVLHTVKLLPTSKEAAWDFYNEYIKGRNCVVHWRMKTHGLIDIENCHPYPIFGPGSQMPMSMMHNGVLHTGNTKDTSRSDTWHYVKDILVPLLNDHPDMFTNPVLVELLEEHIGHGNRFVLLNHLGETVIVNEKDFVTYKGAMLSNTYAWSSEKGGFGFKATRGKYGGTYGYGYGEIDDDYTGLAGYSRTPAMFSPEDEEDTPLVGHNTAAFFLLLKQESYHKAYHTLTFNEVTKAMNDCAPEVWQDFLDVISDGFFLHDTDVIACVRDLDSMFDLIYDYGADMDVDTDEEAMRAGLRLQVGLA